MENHTTQAENSTLVEKFRRIKILESFFTEQVSKEMGLDRVLTQSILQGYTEADEQVIETLTDLIKKLAKVKDSAKHGEVNAEQCSIETKIIAVLTGKMIALDDVEYAPEILDGNPKLPLWSLHHAAEQAYIQHKLVGENKATAKPLKVIPFLHDAQANLKRSA